MEFSMYYIIRSLEDSIQNTIIESSSSIFFDLKKFIRNNKKRSVFQKHVDYFSKKYPQLRNCDIEDSLHKALSKLSKDKPKDEASAKKILKRSTEDALSAMSEKGKSMKKNFSCLKNIKSFSVKGMDLDEVIGKAKGILTGKEKMALDLCSKGKSVRKMSEIMKVSFPTAWRILNRALDKIRVSHGMKSRNKDRR